MARQRRCRRCKRGPLQPCRAHAGGVEHRGRELCGGCYAWCVRHNALDNYPTTQAKPIDRTAVVDAYLELADTGLSKSEIAHRIGVGRGSMYDALARDPRTKPGRQLDDDEVARLRRLVAAR